MLALDTCTFKLELVMISSKQTNKQIGQRSCLISTNLDTMIRLIYMISILIIYTCTQVIFICGERAIGV